MARVQFNGPVAQAPNGYATWEPGEEREVSEGQADELTRNVYFRRVDTPVAGATPEPEPVPAPAAGGPEQAGEDV